MRLLTMVFVLAMTVACASQPQPVEQPAAADASAQPVGTDGEGATEAEAVADGEGSSGALDAEVKRLASQYRAVVRDGQKLYCKRHTPLGSRLSEEICLTEEQLYQMAMRQVEAKDSYRHPKVCGQPCSD